MNLLQATTTLFLLGSTASAKSSIRKLQSTVAATQPAGPEAQAGLFGAGSTVAPGPTDPAFDMNATIPAGDPTEPAVGDATAPAFGGPTEPATGTTGSATTGATEGSITTGSTEGSWLGGVGDTLSNVTDSVSDMAGNATDGFNDWLEGVSGGDDDAGEVAAGPFGSSNTTGYTDQEDMETGDDVVPTEVPPSSAALRFISVSVIGAYAVSAIVSL